MKPMDELRRRITVSSNSALLKHVTDTDLRQITGTGSEARRLPGPSTGTEPIGQSQWYREGQVLGVSKSYTYNGRDKRSRKAPAP